MIIPTSKSKMKILEFIHENPGIKISYLFKKAKVSPQKGYEHVENLLENNIIREKRMGKGTILRLFYPNYGSEVGKQIFSLIETNKKIQFLEKNKELKGPLEQLKDNLKQIEEIKTALIFGSFAKNSKTNESDIDIIFITTKKDFEKSKLDEICERYFITVENPLSARVTTEQNFVKEIQEGNPLYKNIIKDRIVIYNTEGFVEILDRVI